MYPRTLILNPSGSGAFTFATLPVAALMSGEVAGVQAYTSDEGMCYWDGGAWHPSGASGEGLVANTYAAARLLSGVTTGDRLQVLGRTSQSDGGQGLFTWVAGGSTTIDDGTELSAPGGIWRRAESAIRVSMFGAVAATEITSAVQAAISAVPSTGATVQIDVVGTLGTVNVNQPCTVQFAAGSYSLTANAGSGFVVGPNMRVVIQGVPGLLTTLLGSAVGQKLIQYSGLGGFSDKKQTIVKDLVLDGNSLADYGVYMPDNSGSFSIAGQFKKFIDLSVRNFRNTNTAGIWIGQSDYFLSFDHCEFLQNYTDISTGLFTDTTIYRCMLAARFGGPGLICKGTQYRIIATSFTGGASGGNGIGADISFAGTSGGTVYVSGCYFGPEGDVNTRNKIEMTQNFGANVFFENNWFYGVTGQTCFKVTDTLTGWKFRSNSFSAFTYVFDDGQGTTTSLVGLCDFDDSNTVFDFGSGVRTRVFKNGGRDFSKVIYPIQTPGITVPNRLIEHIQNRLHYADGTYLAGVNAYSWNVSGAVTVTTGQTDPRGGTQAVLIADSATASDNWQTKVDTTSMLDDEGNAASGRNGRIVVKFSVKQGNSGANPDVMAFVCLDVTTGGHYYDSIIALTPQWRTHEIVVTGIDPAATTCRLVFYPGGYNAATGSFYFAFPNVSDLGCSDFLPNNDTAMVDFNGNYDTIKVLANSATPKVIGGRNWRTGGTTTITDFLLGYENQVIRILSEHTVTLTHGTNLFLVTGRSRTLVPNDSVSFIQKADGHWYEIAGDISYKIPVILQQSGIPLVIPPSCFIDASGNLIIGQAPSSAATASFSATSGAGVTMTMSAATLVGTAVDVGRVLTILDTTYKYATITAATSTTVATVTITGTLSGTGPFANNAIYLSGPLGATATTTNTGVAFSSPLPAAYANCWMSFKVNGPIAVAGVYFVKMSTTTIGVVYTSTLATNTAPFIPSAPVALAPTPGAYAQTTGTHTLATQTISANSMGLNGFLTYDVSSTMPFGTGFKGPGYTFGAAGITSNAIASICYVKWQNRIANNSVANAQTQDSLYTTSASQVAAIAGVVSVPALVRGAQNTATDLTFSIQAYINTNATDYCVLEDYSLQLCSN